MKKKDIKETGVTPRQYKDVMAQFATGITLVTIKNQSGEPAGLIVNSLASVSLEPPLVLFCLGKSSQLHEVFAQVDQCGVNILNTDQRGLVEQFTSPREDRWADVPYSMHFGAPIVQGSLAYIYCNIVSRHDAGDHTIYVGEVVDLDQGQGEPLLYHNRRFGDFKKLA